MKEIRLDKKYIGFTLLCILITGFAQASLANEPFPFVKKIHVKGNTLLDPYSLAEHFDLGNGLNMNPFIMDLAASELRAVYRFNGHPAVNAYSTLKVNKGAMTLKVDEKNEYRFGAARAKIAINNLVWDFNMNLTEQQQKDTIQKLVKGYKKIKLNEEVVASYLVEKQRARIEEIESQKRAAMREKVATAVKDFKEIRFAREQEQARKIAEMRERAQASASKKIFEVEETPPEDEELPSEEFFEEN